MIVIHSSRMSAMEERRGEIGGRVHVAVLIVDGVQGPGKMFETGWRWQLENERGQGGHVCVWYQASSLVSYGRYIVGMLR